jgi:hypothetical protein
MSTIYTRTTKGSALTWAEGDANIENLNNDKLEDITGESIGDLTDVDIASISDGQVLVWNSGSSSFTAQTPSAGVDSLSALTDTSISAPPTDGYVLTWDETAGFWVDAALPAAGISDVVADTTPQLGGELDCQGNVISNPVLKDYAETIHSLGSTDTPTITVSNGNVQSVTITSGLALPAFADAATGQSVTLLVSGTGSATGTANHKFAGGNKTLTTDSVVSIFYDGTTYWTSIATGFAV